LHSIKTIHACAIALLVWTTLHAQSVPPARALIVRAAHLLDVKAGRYISPAVVLVEDQRVKAVATNLSTPSGAEEIDLGSATLLPGLIDCHTHLLENYDPSLPSGAVNMILTVAQMSTAKRALLGAEMAKEDLEAGITTVRDVGNSGLNGDVALREAINAGWVPGPRMVVSTRALSATGGQFGSLTSEAQKLIDQEYSIVTGVEEARRAVRQAFFDGADLIKVILNNGPRMLGPDEMKAIVDEAHAVRRKVAAHATGALATRIAAEAGVDSIEHANEVPDDVLKVMAAKKVFLVPTDPLIEGLEDVYMRRYHWSREQLEAEFKKSQQPDQDRIRRAVTAGVSIAAGSDEYNAIPGKTRGQASLTILRAYVESGMSALQAIRSATTDAAELLGWQNRVGSIEPNKFADLIAITGDPLQDISELERVRFVMKGGRIVKDTLTKR
jgi:imidazolonepropionase-like amidohydrolase